MRGFLMAQASALVIKFDVSSSKGFYLGSTPHLDAFALQI